MYDMNHHHYIRKGVTLAFSAKYINQFPEMLKVQRISFLP